MRILKSSILVVGAIALGLAAQGLASGPTAGVSHVYTVGSKTVPGVDTGLVVPDGASVRVTATGLFCPFGAGLCLGPDGDSPVDTTTSAFGGFVLPGAPAWGLVGRVGNGSWTQIGSGPTTLSGSGDLVFAVNDDLLVDNAGSFTVTVTVSCWPGHGYGDTNHSHTGPPGQGSDACYPGHGYGDTNHDHYGPPGQSSASPSGQSGAAGPSNGKGKGKGHDK